MDVVVIFNGLGNQMSQYAFYIKKRSINLKNTDYIILNNDHNGFELNKVFGIENPKSLKRYFLYHIYLLLLRIYKSHKFSWIGKMLYPIVRIKRENFDYEYKPDYLKESFGVTFWEGGWHAEEYFIDVKDVIVSSYRFKQISDDENLNLLNQIKNTNSVAVHIRRGDYLLENVYKLFGGIATDEYYLKAIQYMDTKLIQPYYFIFTNDVKWAKQNIIKSNVIVVEHNQRENSWKDLYLMTECKNIILANSSFSWWGAWLNEKGKKIIICPSKFINTHKGNNIFPERWKKII